MKRYIKTLLETESKKKKPAKAADSKPADSTAYARYLIAKRALDARLARKRGDVGTVQK